MEEKIIPNYNNYKYFQYGVFDRVLILLDTIFLVQEKKSENSNVNRGRP